MKEKTKREAEKAQTSRWSSCFFANNGETQRKQWKQQKGKTFFASSLQHSERVKRHTWEFYLLQTQKNWVESRNIQKAEAEWKKEACGLPGSPTAFCLSCYFARNIRKEEKWREKGFPYSFQDLQSSTLSPNKENVEGMEGWRSISLSWDDERYDTAVLTVH